MTPLNGHTVTAPEPLIPATLAQMLWDSDAEDGEPKFADLPADDQASLIQYAEQFIGAHTAILHARGFKIVPPGATPIPTSEAEAMGMVRAAKGFLDAQKRRGKLLGQVSPGLVLPKGSRH